MTAACADAGFTPRLTGRSVDFIGVAAVVAHGFGGSLISRLAYLPADFAVVRVPLHGDHVPVRRHLTVVRRGSGGHPVIAAGLRAIREVCRERADITVLGE
ncbi:hypothetical protein LTV02_01415 [Nocardia yamanashiensis]|uniref:LysR substrate-binding domain-containing protein n=1 Tax=Nocardia yamanashiensis TaxID=209247 RepID=UPI001E33FB30|nr:LysR substrate-binding domain-containing protein [Nocardia yamanashiensis]UGT45555.1 hypothetical protein LTV02_01415 [Nocardia yamanashiensis]